MQTCRKPPRPARGWVSPFLPFWRSTDRGRTGTSLKGWCCFNSSSRHKSSGGRQSAVPSTNYPDARQYISLCSSPFAYHIAIFKSLCQLAAKTPLVLQGLNFPLHALLRRWQVLNCLQHLPMAYRPQQVLKYFFFLNWLKKAADFILFLKEHNKFVKSHALIVYEVCS